MDKEQFIIDLCQKQFGTNLAGIAVFGSYKGGPYKEGESDIDVSVLLHKFDNLDLTKEKSILIYSGEPVRLSVQHLTTSEEIKNRIYREGSWSSWITLICGSNFIYVTNEIKELIKELKNKSMSPENLLNYILHKDEFELKGYLSKAVGWDLTKGLYSHIRRKLQILNYYTNRKIEFSYISCLMALQFTEEEKQRLNWLSEMYASREGLTQEGLTQEASSMYFEIAKELTKKIKLILI